MSAEHAPIIPITEARAKEATNAELVALRATYAADAEYIAEQIARIDAQLIARLGGAGTHDVEGTRVEIREYSRTDYAKLEADYPVSQFPQLYSTKTVLDQTAVKHQFAPEALDGYKVRGKKSVVIR